MVRKAQDSAVARAIDKAGGSAKVAENMGLHRRTVQQWLLTGRIGRSEHLMGVAELAGLTVEQVARGVERADHPL